MNAQSLLLFLLVVWNAGVTYWLLMSETFHLEWTTEIMTLVVSLFVGIGVLALFLQ